jgi:soluble lytic murein transglycosylase
VSSFPFIFAEKALFGYDNAMKCFLFLILFITSCMPVYSDDLDGMAYLKKGKYELDKAKYRDAISSLSSAAKEYPLLGDYALLWLSDAFHENGNHEDSLKTIRTLLRKYPDSPLIRKSRARELKEAAELAEGDMQKLFTAYIRNYPGDTEIRYLYAEWLKNNGQKDEAKALFKDIYLDAGTFAKTALNELSDSDLTVKDIMKRASNLMQKMDYKAAESALTHALEKDDGELRDEILQKLGLALFRQKKYREAAATYKKINEQYWEMRSLFRAGEREALTAALDELLESKDRRMGSVLIALASDKRREGAADEAIRIYKNVMERYPSESEDARWALGWTYFLTKKYSMASETFERLHTQYEDPKYLYWKARSLEAAGADSRRIYTALMENNSDVYSLFAYIRLIEFSGGQDTDTIKKSIRPVKGSPLISGKNNRVEALLELDFLKEAGSEAVYVSKRADSKEELLYICATLLKLGEYSHLAGIARKLPYTEEMLPFLYPLAYGETIEGLSKKYALDPLLVLSIIREESRFDPDARSFAGALGLMQLMPYTAYRLDKTLGLGIDSTHDILKVRNNLHLGMYYLSHLVKEFGSYVYAVAAYNAGEEMVRKWLQMRKYASSDEFIEDIPYGETQNYVKRVLSTFLTYKRVAAKGEETAEIPAEKL